MFSAHALKAGLAVLALSGAVSIWSAPAQAGASTGTWRNGMVDGPYGPGYYHPGGRYYDGGRQRHRGYAREYYRSPRNYSSDGSYYEDNTPYARPGGYRWRGGYGYRPDPYWGEDGGW